MSQSIYASIFMDSLPIMLGATFETIILTINIHYAKDNEMMAGIGLATVLVHCLGGSLIYGFNVGFTNFASRAFGAKNREKYNQFVIQGLTNLAILLVLFALMGFSSYKLAIVTGQQESIALYSYKTIVYQLPGLACFYTSDFIRNCMNSQLVFKPIIYIFGICIGIHILLSVTISSSLGFNGIILSTNATFITLLICMFYIQRKYATYKLSLDIFKVNDGYHEYKEFALECFYVAMPFCLDLFMYEFMTLYLGSFQLVEQMAAHVAVSNICNIMIAPYVGYSFCTMTKIGNYIGQNKPEEITKFIRAATIMSWISIYILQILVLVFRHPLTLFFTNEPEVQRYIYMVFNNFIIQYFFDATQFMGSHAFKALGMGGWVMKIFFISLYMIGSISMIILCQFMQAKILAVWMGFTFGEIFLAGVLVHKFYNIDIKQITSRLHEKVKRNDELGAELMHL